VVLNDTLKFFVNTILSSYKELQINLLDLLLDQDMVWLVEC
jgi:hypothetical protein